MTKTYSLENWQVLKDELIATPDLNGEGAWPRFGERAAELGVPSPIAGYLWTAVRNGRELALRWANNERPVRAPLAKNEGPFRLAVGDDELEAITDPTWLIDGFLPQGGYGLMIGAPRSKKTFIALDIALSVASGLGKVWEVNGTGPVLFAAGEGRSFMKKRVAAWRDEYGPATRNFVLADPVPQAIDADHVEALIERALEAHPKGYKLIVIDTLDRAMAGLNENAQQDAGRFTAMVEAVSKGLRRGPDEQCTVLALHHLNASGGARGSTAFIGAADTVVFTEHDELGVALRMAKQKDGEEWRDPKVVEFKVTPHSLVAVVADQKQSKAVRAKVRGQKTNSKAPGIDVAKLARIDDALPRVLHPSRVTNNAHLSRLILGELPDLDLSADAISRRYLPALRDDRSRTAFLLYDRDMDKWHNRMLRAN